MAKSKGRSYVFYGRTADPELAWSIDQSHGPPALLDHARHAVTFLDESSTVTTQMAYGPECYPGTFDVNASVPIVVGDATEHDGVEFQRVR
jgi:hypothetical protein